MSLQVRARWAQRGLDVDLDVPAGRHAITGPNGAGKSSLLAVVAGLARPDESRVVLDGRPLDGLPPHRRRVVLMSQSGQLFPHLGVRDNVAFGPRSQGRGRRESRAAADHWLEVVGMRSFADRRPAQLSGGQAARVALARALAAEPAALLLDEPLAALDVEATPAMRAVLSQVTHEREDLVVLLVTHDVLDALLLADPVTGPERTVRVLPGVGSREPAPLRPRATGVVGAHRTRRAGEGLDLLDVREFHPGDSTRRIDWRVSARRGTLHVRRGLATTRSATMEERKVRGVMVTEPWQQRWQKGASLSAIVTGARCSATSMSSWSNARLRNVA